MPTVRSWSSADEGDVHRNKQALTVILTEWIAQTQRLKS